MQYSAIILLAAEFAICHGLVIETTVKDAPKNEAVTALPSASSTASATLPFANKTVSSNIQHPPTDAVNSPTANPTVQNKVKKEVTPKNKIIASDISKEKTEADSIVRVPTVIDKTPKISPFLPFLPLGDHPENPLFHFFQDVLNKPNKTERDDSAQKRNARKPFLFFDFVFDIREMQPEVINSSETEDLAKQKREVAGFNFKKPVAKESPNEKWLKRSVQEDESFFEDSRLFHPLDLEEFLPKPEFFFFPENFMHSRSQSKRSLRRKRDEKPKTLRFADETRKILLRKKRTGSRHEDILRSLAEKLKKEAESKKADLKKFTNKFVKIGELHPKLLADKGKRENEKKVENSKKLETPKEELKQTGKKLVKDEKKQGGN